MYSKAVDLQAYNNNIQGKLDVLLQKLHSQQQQQQQQVGRAATPPLGQQVAGMPPAAALANSRPLGQPGQPLHAVMAQQGQRPLLPQQQVSHQQQQQHLQQQQQPQPQQQLQQQQLQQELPRPGMAPTSPAQQLLSAGYPQAQHLPLPQQQPQQQHVVQTMATPFGAVSHVPMAPASKPMQVQVGYAQVQQQQLQQRQGSTTLQTLPTFSDPDFAAFRAGVSH